MTELPLGGASDATAADVAGKAATGQLVATSAGAPPDRRLLDVTMGPGKATLESTSRGELPADVLEAGVKRLGMLALVCAASLIAVLGLLTLVARHDAQFRSDVLPRALGCLIPAIVLNLGMLWLSRARRIRAQVVLELSQFYVVLFALALSALRHGFVWPTSEPLRSWSPVAVLLVMFGALVPARPARVLTTCVLAALTDPLALYLAQTASERPEPQYVALLLLSPAAGVGLAYLSSKLLYGLTEHITRAREVGSYRLEKRLGIGGMGEVWKAKHHMLARPAAIKLIRPRILSSQGPEEAKRLLKLFEREAQITASLYSPHTIQLFDYGVTQDGTFYYVMELLDGFDLQTLVEKFGKQPPERAAYLLIQACDSLHEAHMHQLVHRDLKPANIFSCRYGGELDFVKVLDFGLVMDRRPTEEELDDPGLIGTPAIMAPEMVRFNAPVDQRADIYALGCVAYWLLTRLRVFEAQNRADMLIMHAHQRPVPPSKRVGISVPKEFEELILQCLAKNPDKRPQSARELGDRLRELGLHHGWSRPRREDWWREHSPAPEPPPARTPSKRPATAGREAAPAEAPPPATPATAGAGGAVPSGRGPWV
ncbi:MAG TPA: serine/threonine-protein kinase [Polyangiaceae bacterium]|nr:serine/threonine-protein kinase [Polyangiaceae bacterium]